MRQMLLLVEGHLGTQIVNNDGDHGQGRVLTQQVIGGEGAREAARSRLDGIAGLREINAMPGLGLGNLRLGEKELILGVVHAGSKHVEQLVHELSPFSVVRSLPLLECHWQPGGNQRDPVADSRHALIEAPLLVGKAA